jgi:hypothetical protein
LYSRKIDQYHDTYKCLGFWNWQYNITKINFTYPLFFKCLTDITLEESKTDTDYRHQLFASYQLIDALSEPNTEEKMLKVLKILCQVMGKVSPDGIEIELPHSFLAACLGTGTQNIGRCLNTLEARGAIARRRRFILLKDFADVLVA